MWRAVGAFLLSVSLLSCEGAPSCEGRYTVSGFSPEELQGLEHVAARWGQFSGREVTFTSGTSETCHIHPVADIEGGALGIYRRTSGNLEVKQRGPGADFETTVAHEVGHGFGLRHVTDERAIMYRAVAGPDFTDADHIECERVGVCARPAAEVL